jgi:hypothetical protein
VLCWAVVVGLVVMLGGLWFVTRPHRLAAIAGSVLEQLSGMVVRIESARFTISGGIDLTKVQLLVPGVEGQGAELFTAKQMFMRINPWALLRGQFEARQLALIEPVVALTEIAENEFNYERVRRINSSRDLSDDVTLPRITIRGGRLRYGEVHDGQYQSTGEMIVTGSLNPVPDSLQDYRFELFEARDGDEGSIGGPSLSGTLNLKNLEVKAQIADFAFVDPHRNLLPRQIRKWWDMFEPSGSLPKMKFDYDARTGPRAEINVDGVALTLLQLSDADYKARMTGVTGTFRFNADRIEIVDLVGQIEGLEYRIQGQIDGYSKDAPFSLKLATRPFRVPEKPQYSPAMPAAVQTVFRMLTPVGWMSVTAVAERKRLESGEVGPVEYYGSATILSGRDLINELTAGLPLDRKRQVLAQYDVEGNDPALISRGMYFRFPYQLTNCRGKITFKRDTVIVNSLTGTLHGGGSATIEGTIAALGEDPFLDLTVTAVNVVFDEVLKNAMPPEQRQAMDLFLHEPSYQRLLEAGLFVTSDERKADEITREDLKRRIREMGAMGQPDAAAELNSQLQSLEPRLKLPVFDLGGRGNCIVRITREAGPGPKLRITPTIDLAGTHIVFEHFPYPLRLTGGRLTVSRNQAHFENITAEGLAGGTGTLNGTIHYDKPITPELELTATKLPIDKLLMAALPPDRAERLAWMGLAGDFNVAGRIFRNPSSPKIDIDFKLSLDGATAQPGGGKYDVHDIAGSLKLSLASMVVERITAWRGATRITFDERTRMDADGSLTVGVEATDMRFEDPVPDLVALCGDAERAREIWDLRKPRGVFDAQFVTTRKRGEEGAYQLVIKPRELEFTHEQRRVSLEKMSGELRVVPGEVTLGNLAGVCDGASIAFNGTMSESGAADLSIRAEGAGIGPNLREVLPDAVERVLTAMQFSGGFKVDVSKLAWPANDPNHEKLELRASVALSGASGQLGPRVEGFDGTVAIAVVPPGVGEEGSKARRIDAAVVADRLQFAGRQLEKLTLQMQSTADGQSMLIPKLSARCYEGQIGGSGALRIDNGEFHLALALVGAELERMVDRAKSDKDGTAPMRGRMSASLSLQGNWRDPAALRGRGDVMVREGDLAGVPLSMGLLQVAHLQLPGPTRFHQAVLSYYLRGDRAVFERIELEGKSMRLSGSGSLLYAGSDLDLTLTTSNPQGLNLGAVTTIINSMRNQLVTIRITGPLNEPQVRVRQFNGLVSAWQDVFEPAQR